MVNRAGVAEARKCGIESEITQTEVKRKQGEYSSIMPYFELVARNASTNAQ